MTVLRCWMGIEIERKFLVSVSDWQNLPSASVMRLRQGYLSVGGPDAATPPETRVRISESLTEAASHAIAYLTIKGQGTRTRQEIEFEIPVSQAEEILGMCAGRTLLKDRYTLPISGRTWEVDVYCGPLEGLVVAEVELPSENAHLDLPSWVGQELSDDKSFKNAHLVSCRWTDHGLAPRLINEVRRSSPRP